MFTTIFKLVRGIHITNAKNVTSRETNVLTKFHEDWTKNVTSNKTAPPPGGHVFSLIWTVFKHIRGINKTNVLTKFHDDWAKTVTSRVFTRNTAPPPGGHVFQRTIIGHQIFELSRGIIGTNVLTMFHEDRIGNVASRVFTRTTDKRRSQKVTMSTLCSEEVHHKQQQADSRQSSKSSTSIIQKSMSIEISQSGITTILFEIVQKIYDNASKILQIERSIVYAPGGDDNQYFVFTSPFTSPVNECKNETLKRISGMQLNYKVNATQRKREKVTGMSLRKSSASARNVNFQQKLEVHKRYHIAKGNATCSAPNIMYEVMTCRLPGAGS
ncbi:hypothetical protein DPMN_160841 [Dreissena polymorpha]|uniref:Uncharacterized protein n=1 Tax=Dreissena polymorpha TaxID=45954 RepID=A0A9D4IS31_DREPO|nr:hypothetical protein DPMN_160841 [Dreissena polymorpha]